MSSVVWPKLSIEIHIRGIDSTDTSKACTPVRSSQDASSASLEQSRSLERARTSQPRSLPSG